jgi:hypothetical protein
MMNSPKVSHRQSFCRLLVSMAPKPCRPLSLAGTYRCHAAVVSYNWIGSQSVQDALVPIINLGHLKDALKKTASLTCVVAWLIERRYLPTEGIHFRIVQGEVAIRENSAVWYDIEPLISGIYDPLENMQTAV